MFSRMASAQTELSAAAEPSFYAGNDQIIPSATTSSGGNLLDAKYDFRPFARVFPNNITTWVDQDESGDFDPTCKKSDTLIPLTKKRERPLYNNNDPELVFKKPKLNTWQSGRRIGLSCSITIKLKSDRGKALLQEIGVHCNNWPELKIQNREKNFTEINPDSVQSQRLRRHSLSSATHSGSSESFPSLDDITLGHPAARGCKGCVEIGASCTLLQEGSTYPCAACRDDDTECELVLPPAKKRACESCRRRRIVCSYRSDTNDHSSPCRQCEDSGAKCVAGPLSGRTRTGPCLNQDPTMTKLFIPTVQRPFITCTQCRTAKRYCSLRYNRNVETCRRCTGLKQECTFEAVSNPRRKRNLGFGKESCPETEGSGQTPTLLQTANSSQDSEPPPLSLPSVFAHNSPVPGTTRVIKTRLAHPVTFNHLVPEDGTTFCHWCNDISYGLLGLGEVHVKVIESYDNRDGYIEIDGGHTAQGQDPSRMCHKCTASRLFIACCPEHIIQPIKNTDPDIFDDVEVLKWLEPDLMSSVPFEWCSICVKPASFSCKNPSAMGPSLLKDEAEDEDEEFGCGLYLCEGCAVTLLEYDGKLNDLIAMLETDEDCGPLDIRADANFLHSDGHLMRRIHGS